jgi:hypothetical protein
VQVRSPATALASIFYFKPLTNQPELHAFVHPHLAPGQRKALVIRPPPPCQHWHLVLLFASKNAVEKAGFATPLDAFRCVIRTMQ